MTRFLKIFGMLFFLGFVFVNVVAYNHAYKFTHFQKADSERTQKPEDLSIVQKLKILFWGVSIPKSKNDQLPKRPYETIYLQSHNKLEGWLIDIENHKGIVILFHGYSSCKSGILNYSNAFNAKGYSTLIMDFMGNGGSEGFQTTIGVKESRDVKAAFDFVKQKYPNTDENNKVFLFGSSMGAVSIMKSINDYNLKPNKIVIECPFGSMVKTTANRFEAMNLPSFPFTQLLLFYGGLQNGFNAFSHKPIEYAKKIKIPTLLMRGQNDKRVSSEETNQIFENLAGEKELVILQNAGHENYLHNEAENWKKSVFNFLE